MTSSQDEIENLRSHLESIRQWCSHEIRYQTNDLGAAALKIVENMAKAGLKTPRASKEIRVSITGLPPPFYP